MVLKYNLRHSKQPVDQDLRSVTVGAFGDPKTGRPSKKAKVTVLSATAFEMLLRRLDVDPVIAADKYEVLRLKLIKSVIWRGCPESQADRLADAAIDRIAVKIEKGESIENVNAYASEVIRFVWLEYSRKSKEDTLASEDFPEIISEPIEEHFDDVDHRMNCLRKCLNEVVPDDDDRSLIVGYYDTCPGQKNKDQRRDIAQRFGLSMNTLKVKACRIRARLESCINGCVGRVVMNAA